MTKVKHLKNAEFVIVKNLTKIVKLSKMPFTDEFMTLKNIGKEFLHDINVFYVRIVKLYKLNMTSLHKTFISCKNSLLYLNM